MNPCSAGVTALSEVAQYGFKAADVANAIREINGAVNFTQRYARGLPVRRAAARTGPNRPRDNVVAEHYTGTTLAGFLTSDPAGDDELGDINAQLSHLAVRRRESRLWPVTDMACRCGKAMQQFVTAARPEFKPALSEVRIQAGRLAGLCGTDPMVMTSTN